MNRYFAYIRVSTTRQGEHGVSLQQQRESIERYATTNGFEICQWFEEQETAAKRGRPKFSQMLSLLKRRRAAGVIIHKIDRSARNLKDWAELGDLIDAGIVVHFANESLDLTSRGGRLSADLQAVIAADFIRNLREETKKGFYGRLKQGLYPRPAPLGYLDTKAGQAKIPDPTRADLVKKAFELYATGKYNQVSLGDEMYRLGLRSRSGRRLDKNFLGRMLRNPFYMGIIHIQKNDDSYIGIHEPIVSKNLFDEVQRVLSGNFCGVRSKHDFLFRQLFSCKLCGRSLVGESHIGHVYYRCQKRSCPTTGIREEEIDNAVVEKLRAIQLNVEAHEYLTRQIEDFHRNWTEHKSKALDSLQLQIAQIKDRLNRITDAYLDGDLDREAFTDKKTALLMERRGLEDRVQQLHKNNFAELPPRLTRLLEIINRAYSLYISSLPEEKRELIRYVSSNRTLFQKNVEITLSMPFTEVANCRQITGGRPLRTNTRIWDRLAEFLFQFFQSEEHSTDVSP